MNHWVPRKRNRTLDEFIESSRKNGIVGCWEFGNAADKDGYCRSKIDGASYRSHRVSYALYVGPIPTGMYVLHKCDNPACVRPSHLFIGTAHDNANDAARKGRNSRGSRNGVSKLVDDDVIFIRNSGLTLKHLSLVFGIRWQYVWMVKSKRRWKHVND